MDIIFYIIFFAILALDIFLVFQINFLNMVRKNPNDFCIVQKKSGFRIMIGGGNAPLLSPIKKIERKAQQKDVITSNPDDIKNMARLSLVACIVVIISSIPALFLILAF